MKIRIVKSDQFAGLLDKEAKFSDGLNLVVGDNETGKSTLVDLLYSILFQNSKLSRKTDSEFINKYFPKNASGPQGDTIDGTVVFETEEGTYRLKKEWDFDGGSVRLTLPDGTKVRSDERINEIIRDLLTHERGVYSEIVFASQKREQMAVESIMTALANKKKDEDLSNTREALTSVLNQAVLETGGVSIDLIEKKLDEKITKLDGNWDFDYDLPKGGRKRGIENQWARNRGEILEAYYAMETIRADMDNAKNAEEAVEACKEELKELEESKSSQEASLQEFRKYAQILEKADSLKTSIEEKTDLLEEREEILEAWPDADADLKHAQDLKQRKAFAEIHDQYVNAEKARKAYEAAAEALKNLKEVNTEDVTKAQRAERAVQSAESRINGMNLEAALKLTGKMPVEIRTVSNDEPIDLSSGRIHITEAVVISIPGVMEMELMPKGTDLKAVKKELNDSRKILTDIFQNYEVNDLEELREAEEAYSEAAELAEDCKADLERILAGETWNALKKSHSKVPADIETTDEIDEMIEELCEYESIDEFIGALRSRIQEYTKKYNSAADLKKLIKEEKAKLKKLQDELNSIGDIPEEFREIDDPEEYEEECTEAIEDLERQIKDSSAGYQEAYRRLYEKSSEEYADELSAAEAVFEAKKREYDHWDHIRSVFHAMKNQNKGNPAAGIEEKFREYLSVITDGTVKLSDMDEKMFVSLESGEHALSYDILSEGTKDTISLAFRLAMLEHLFPEGNGLAVFDDPFTDMDPTRVKHACELIKKFAEKNQVIFVTCDDKYKKLFPEGNVVKADD